MKHVLSPPGVRLLRDVARSRPLLVFDFDGTLAPIVDEPGLARMREETFGLLHEAALLHPCAIVSGRSREDVLGRVRGIPLRAVVGNHGAETEGCVPDRALRARVRAWASALHDAVEGDGVRIEDHGFTLAVHFRDAAAPRRAERRIELLASALPGARVFGGPDVINVAPAEARNKGHALAALADRFPSRAVVYVGDDESDEEAFRSPAASLSIRVGRSDRSAARWFLTDQPEVDALLALLCGRDPA